MAEWPEDTFRLQLPRPIGPGPAGGVVDAIAEHGFERLPIGAAEHTPAISRRDYTLPNLDADALGQLGILIAPIGGAVLA
jgi:hypothetical protein